MNEDDRRAISIYAVAARDFMDFLDMVKEPSSTDASLCTLLQMCRQKGQPDTDEKLNDLMVGPLERELSRRGHTDRCEVCVPRGIHDA